MNELRLEDLQALVNMNEDDDNNDGRGVFVAEELIVEIRNPDGKIIATSILEPRAFKPSKSKTGVLKGGCGWYTSKIEGDYKGLPLTAGFRISLKGIKIEAGRKINLIPNLVR